MKKPIWEKTSGGMDLWVEEQHRGTYSTRWRCKNVLFSKQSKYQHIEVVDTFSHGTLLLNDGIVMLSEKDEFIYHEMIAHVPLFSHPCPKKLLIIGGGDGGSAREALKHESVSECVLVEIDKMVVDVAKKYFPQVATSFKNPKLKLKIQDGVQFVKNTSQKFDVVLVDSTDPFGPAEELFSKTFYKHVYNLLKKDGILVVQAESPFFEIKTQQFILHGLKAAFPLVSLYNYSNTVYPGGLWSFAFASKKYHPIKDFKAQRLQKSKFKLCYYNKEIHKAAFAKPEFMKKNLNIFSL